MESGEQIDPDRPTPQGRPMVASMHNFARREFLAGSFAMAAFSVLAPSGVRALTEPAQPSFKFPSSNVPVSRLMNIVCIIRYEIDPFQREAFRQYAETWGGIIPRCGGHLVGYFLPWQGTNYVGWGLIALDSLSAYETYQARLRRDPEARKNLAFAQEKRFILREERNFVEVVDGTFEIHAIRP